MAATVRTAGLEEARARLGEILDAATCDGVVNPLRSRVGAAILAVVVAAPVAHGHGRAPWSVEYDDQTMVFPDTERHVTISVDLAATRPRVAPSTWRWASASDVTYTRSKSLQMTA